jgi:hypothetical protein
MQMDLAWPCSSVIPITHLSRESSTAKRKICFTHHPIGKHAIESRQKALYRHRSIVGGFWWT